MGKITNLAWINVIIYSIKIILAVLAVVYLKSISDSLKNLSKKD